MDFVANAVSKKFFTMYPQGHLSERSANTRGCLCLFLKIKLNSPRALADAYSAPKTFCATSKSILQSFHASQLPDYFLRFSLLRAQKSSSYQRRRGI